MLLIRVLQTLIHFLQSLLNEGYKQKCLNELKHKSLKRKKTFHVSCNHGPSIKKQLIVQSLTHATCREKLQKLQAQLEEAHATIAKQKMKQSRSLQRQRSELGLAYHAQLDRQAIRLRKLYSLQLNLQRKDMDTMRRAQKMDIKELRESYEARLQRMEHEHQHALDGLKKKNQVLMEEWENKCASERKANAQREEACKRLNDQRAEMQEKIREKDKTSQELKKVTTQVHGLLKENRDLMVANKSQRQNGVKLEHQYLDAVEKLKQQHEAELDACAENGAANIMLVTKEFSKLREDDFDRLCAERDELLREKDKEHKKELEAQERSHKRVLVELHERRVQNILSLQHQLRQMLLEKKQTDAKVHDLVRLNKVLEAENKSLIKQVGEREQQYLHTLDRLKQHHEAELDKCVENGVRLCAERDELMLEKENEHKKELEAQERSHKNAIVELHELRVNKVLEYLHQLHFQEAKLKQPQTSI